MAFCRSLACGVPAAFALVAGRSVATLTPGPCRGPIQFMHLGHKADPGGRRQEDDVDGAQGCESHHKDIDGRIGGLAPWYVALERDGQRRLRKALMELAQLAWDDLSSEERAYWDEQAASQRRAA